MAQTHDTTGRNNDGGTERAGDAGGGGGRRSRKIGLAGARVLVVCDRPSVRERITLGLLGQRANVNSLSTIAAAEAWGESNTLDLVIVDSALGDEATVELIGRIGRNRAVARVIHAERPDAELAVRGMRAGASDMLDTGAPTIEMRERLVEAMRRAAALRNTKAGKNADSTRAAGGGVRSAGALAAKTGVLARVPTARVEDQLPDLVKHVELAAELRAVFRQELELESLLRTFLECLLKRSGPTNAAVFLPASTGDWTLGAYVNYDCPRDQAESILDSMADTLPAKFEQCGSSNGGDVQAGVVMRLFSTPGEAARILGSTAPMVGDSTLTVLSCVQDGECVAVVALFRDYRSPFGESLLPMLRIFGEQFGAQLSRVVKTNCRHLPKDKWGQPGDHGWGDIDLAA